MNNELKPCPFCGGEDKNDFCINVEGNNWFKRWYVRCINCGASGSIAGRQKAAIAAWNKRSGK